MEQHALILTTRKKKIEEEEVDAILQYPIRLAWAITAHKSQGLYIQTGEYRLHGRRFAGGQTYVALSRCTSLEGVRLQEPPVPPKCLYATKVKQFARNYATKASSIQPYTNPKLTNNIGVLFKLSTEATCNKVP